MRPSPELNTTESPRLLVVGDVILDRYIWGNANRVSPESPVLVLNADQEQIKPGGAASVAFLLRGLGAQVSLFGVTGDDGAGRTLRHVLAEEHIDLELSVDEARPTTQKDRFLGRAARKQPHQILRVDYESTRPLASSIAEPLVAAVVEQIDTASAILIADYHKGVCTPPVLSGIITAARERKVPVIVDPARIADYARYRGATLLKPNRQEAELATASEITTIERAKAACQELSHRHGFPAVMVTLDADGIAIWDSASGSQSMLPAIKREVLDITGAGDMVLAVMGFGMASGWSLEEAAHFANRAAGLLVEQLGITQVTWKQLVADVPDRTTCKRIAGPQLLARVSQYRRAGLRIVFTNGCFDLLHAGHVHCLQAAAREGDVLIVGMNSDASVRALKGPERPLIDQHSRAAMLSALACVDHVVIFDETDPNGLLEIIRPDTLVKGGTYLDPDVVGRDVVEKYGGRICLTDRVNGVSTTDLVNRIRQHESPLSTGARSS